MVQLRNMFNAACDAYGEDQVVESFAKNLQAAQWREIVEALGFDPSKITSEMIAQAMDAADVIWEDKTLRQDLTNFAWDYVKAQHAVELTQMGGGAALEIVITAILAALTAGAGLAAATAAKARHLPKLRKLGDLLLEFVEQSKKLGRYLKEKAKRAAKGEKGKPLDAEPAVERVNEPPKRPLIRTAAEDRAEISRLSKDAEKALKDGNEALFNEKIAHAREILEPHVPRNAGETWDAVIERLDVSSPKDGAVFWSGSPDAAKKYADSIGGVALETTDGGRVIDQWKTGHSWDIASGPPPHLKDLWAGVSEKYASEISGKVNVIQTDNKLWDPNTIWHNQEKALVIDKYMTGEVTDIKIHVLKSDGSTAVLPESYANTLLEWSPSK